MLLLLCTASGGGVSSICQYRGKHASFFFRFDRYLFAAKVNRNFGVGIYQLDCLTDHAGAMATTHVFDFEFHGDYLKDENPTLDLATVVRSTAIPP